MTAACSQCGYLAICAGAHVARGAGCEACRAESRLGFSSRIAAVSTIRPTGIAADRDSLPSSDHFVCASRFRPLITGYYETDCIQRNALQKRRRKQLAVWLTYRIRRSMR